MEFVEFGVHASQNGNRERDMIRPSFPGLATAFATAGLLSWGGPAAAQDATCRGWTSSCAAVEVHAEGDRLILFSPNATLPEPVPETGGATVPSERVRVLAERPGEACDATSGAGCEDLTGVWGSADASGEAASADPGNLSCRDDDVWMARARGLEDGEDRCRRAPLAAYFLVALPVGLYVLGPDGEAPLVDRPFPGEPGAGLPDPGDGSSDGTSSGGDATGGSSGGDATGGNSGNGGSGGTGGDATGGDTGSGATGGTPGGGGDDPSDPWDGDLGLPPEKPRPPMSEVPEPISTTLFGLGLAGYAGARIRQRRAARLEGDEEPA